MVQGKEMSTPTIDTELRDLLVKYGALQFSVNPIAMQKLKALIEPADVPGRFPDTTSQMP